MATTKKDEKEVRKTDASLTVIPQRRKDMEIIDSVIKKVQEKQSVGLMNFPKDYNWEIALRGAMFQISEIKDKDGRSALDTCTQSSIFDALSKMLNQGLNPAKNQCAFIPYGDRLIMQREYPGSMMLAMRFGGVDEVPTANIVYEGDVFEYSIDESGYKKIIKHEQKLENIDENHIRGAYATLHLSGGKKFVDIMTWQQIKVSWMQGAAKGGSPSHRNFPSEMAKRTVINRACKVFINSSTDAGVYDDEEPTDNAKAKLTTAVAKTDIQTVDFDHSEDVTNIPETEKGPETSKAPEPEAQRPDNVQAKIEPKGDLFATETKNKAGF